MISVTGNVVGAKASEIPPKSMVTADEFAAMLCVSKRKLVAMKSAGQLPRPVALPGGRLIRWRRAEVDAWIASLPAAA